MGSITVCPVHIFPPPTELIVCYQLHRQEVMPGQKSIYETFLVQPKILVVGGQKNKDKNTVQGTVT